MKVSSVLAEIVSEFSGFQHLHTSKSNTSLSTAPSRKASTSSESVPRHSLNITIGAAPLTRNNSFSSLNSTVSYLNVE